MQIRNPYIASAIAIALTSVALGVFVQNREMRSIEAARKTAFYEKSVSLGALIDRQLVEAIEISRAMRVVMSQIPDIQPDRYQAVASALRHGRDYILNIAVAPELVVKYVHPIEGNESVVGFDVRSVPEQWEAVELAASVGEPIVSGPVALVQGGHGFIVRVPAFSSDKHQTENTLGLISVVMSTKPLATILAEVELAGAKVAIRGQNGLVEDGDVIMGPADVFASNPVLFDVVLPFGRWQIGIRPDVPWDELPVPVLQRIWGSIIAIALFGMVIVSMILQFQSRKKRAEYDLSAAIESINDGFAMFDPQDRLILCNSRYAELYELPDEMVRPGTPFRDILKYGLDQGKYPEARGRADEWLTERMDLHLNPGESFNQLFHDGRWVKIAESKTSNGSVVGFRVDITDLKNAQEAAERAHQIKSQFLNNVNHEMRTPLTVMLGYAPLLGDIRKLNAFARLASTDAVSNSDDALPLLEKLAEDVGKLACKMQNSGNHLLNLINDTLDMSKIESGEMGLDLKPVHVAPLIDSIADEFSMKLNEKKIELVSANIDFLVLADEMRLRQILVNLIGNAIKFTEEGRILVEAKNDGTELEINVSDTGCGIAPRHLSKIFDEFYQGDASTTRKHGGTGLGLAISQKLATLLGGQLKAHSVEGVGSRFSVKLPIFDDSTETVVVENVQQMETRSASANAVTGRAVAAG